MSEKEREHMSQRYTGASETQERERTEARERDRGARETQES